MKMAIGIRRRSRAAYILAFPFLYVIFCLGGWAGIAMSRIGVWGEDLCGWIGFDPWGD